MNPIFSVFVFLFLSLTTHCAYGIIKLYPPEAVVMKKLVQIPLESTELKKHLEAHLYPYLASMLGGQWITVRKFDIILNKCFQYLQWVGGHDLEEILELRSYLFSEIAAIRYTRKELRSNVYKSIPFSRRRVLEGKKEPVLNLNFASFSIRSKL